MTRPSALDVVEGIGERNHALLAAVGRRLGEETDLRSPSRSRTAKVLHLLIALLTIQRDERARMCGSASDPPDVWEICTALSLRMAFGAEQARFRAALIECEEREPEIWAEEIARLDDELSKIRVRIYQLLEE